jgi:hypothetical protein
MENNDIEAGAKKWEPPLARTENTYENIPREVLIRAQPIQSISDPMRRSMMRMG